TIFHIAHWDIGSNVKNIGVSATIGIKAGGTQSANRLLVSKDSASPYVGNGKALLLTTADMHPPRITTASFNYLVGHSATFTFSENVNATLAKTDFLVQNLTTSTTIPSSQIALSYQT